MSKRKMKPIKSILTLALVAIMLSVAAKPVHPVRGDTDVGVTKVEKQVCIEPMSNPAQELSQGITASAECPQPQFDGFVATSNDMFTGNRFANAKIYLRNCDIKQCLWDSQDILYNII